MKRYLSLWTNVNKHVDGQSLQEFLNETFLLLRRFLVMNTDLSLIQRRRNIKI